MHVAVHRRADDGCLKRFAAGDRLDRAGEIDAVEIEDDVGIAQGRARGFGAALTQMQRMIRWERRAGQRLRDDAGVQRFGERDARVPGFGRAGTASGEDHEMARAFERGEDAFHVGRGRCGFVGRRILRDRRQRERRAQLLLLDVGVEEDDGRAVRERRRDLVGAQDRVDGGTGRTRRVVPLREVADEVAHVLRRVDPVDPGAALLRVDRAVGAEDQHRRAIAPGVEDRHRGVHQADVAMHDGKHRLARDLRIALSDRDRVLLVQAQQHLRVLVAEIVDDAVVQAAIACARDERGVFEIQRAQYGGDGVAAPTHVGHLRRFGSRRSHSGSLPASPAGLPAISFPIPPTPVRGRGRGAG
jgi:hypothetical protein